MNPFVWGAGGQQLSPDQLSVARSLAGADMSPVGSPIEGFARMANSAVDNYNANPLNQFPDQPGGNTIMGALSGLGSRLMGMGGLF